MKTYSHSRIVDIAKLFKKLLFTTREGARHAYNNYIKIKEQMKQTFNEDVEGLKILDVGCGQRFPYTFLLSTTNDVTGIDLDVILYKHDVFTYKAIITNNGLNRFLKTFMRSIFFDKTYFQELKRIQDDGRKRRFRLLRMDAAKLQLPSNSIDFVISINAFEHFEHVEKVVREIKRVLKPGGQFYISIDVFSGCSGGHDDDPDHPWNHLLDESFKPNVYLNKMRMDDYIKIFQGIFDKLHVACAENPRSKRLLTPALKERLSKMGYSERELVMGALVVMGEA